MIYDKITENSIGAAIEIHRALGLGLLKSAYQECLYFELKSMEYSVQKEISQPIVYKTRSWL